MRPQYSAEVMSAAFIAYLPWDAIEWPSGIKLGYESVSVAKIKKA